MLTDDQKCELIARIISTKEGREKIIQIAKDSGTLDKLGDAIIGCFDAFSVSLKDPQENK